MRLFKDTSADKDQVLKAILFACLSFAFVAASFNWPSARKVFYACSIIGFAALIFSKPKMTLKKLDLLLPLSLFLFGAGVLVWAIVCDASDGNGNYYSYKSLGKITISALLLMLFFQSGSRLILEKSATFFFAIVFFLLTIALVIFSSYQSFYLHLDRASVGASIATMAAYMVSIAALTCAGFILGNSSSLGIKKLSLIFMVFIFTYVSIILTETRSAILAFPLIFLVHIFLFKTKQQIPHKGKFIFFILLIVGIVGHEFGHTLKNRMNTVLVDIHGYSLHNNSTTSLGARIAMYKTGANAGMHAPIGQTIEQRADFIKLQVLNDPKNSGVLRYLYANLHNEIIENYSLRGIWGVSLLLFVYFSILYTAIIKRNSFLFAIGLSVVLYGLTDVIFSDDLPLTYYIAIIFSLYITPMISESMSRTNA